MNILRELKRVRVYLSFAIRSDVALLPLGSIEIVEKKRDDIRVFDMNPEREQSDTAN